MNGNAIVKFRGRDETVRYIDHGYNDRTGVQRIDWHFTHPMPHNINLTKKEEEAIYDQLVEICWSITHGAAPWPRRPA
jgi:hypothetical protein